MPYNTFKEMWASVTVVLQHNRSFDVASPQVNFLNPHPRCILTEQKFCHRLVLHSLKVPLVSL